MTQDIDIPKHRKIAKYYIIYQLAIVGTLIMFSCTAPSQPNEITLQIDTSLCINELPYDDLYYTYHSEAALDEEFIHDSMGVILVEVRGKTYYHPVTIFHKGIEYHDLFHITGNQDYLSKSILQGARLIKIMTEDGLFPYNYEHTHGDTHMLPPWYSGMAQGQALTLFSRLYEDTQDITYLKAAKKVFSTLNQMLF